MKLKLSIFQLGQVIGQQFNRYKYQWIVVCFSCSFLQLKAQQLVHLTKPDTVQITNQLKLNQISFRGLAVLNQKVFWCAGSKGVVGLSSNAGSHIQFKQLEGYAQSDFRDIHLFNQQEVILSCAGFPAMVLKSTNAGGTWSEVFRKNDSAFFIDGIDFKGKKGIMLCDPIHGKFMVYQTKNAGATWQLIDTANAPKITEGESAFAASGSSIQWVNPNTFAFVSGGTHAKLYCYQTQLKKWKTLPLPMMQGHAAQGAFSFCQFKKNRKAYLAIVGGDYTNDSLSKLNNGLCIVQLHPLLLKHQYKGFDYRSCIKAINKGCFLTTGTKGTSSTSIQANGELNHEVFNEGYHVIGQSTNKKFILLAGSKGRIARWKN